MDIDDLRSRKGKLSNSERERQKKLAAKAEADAQYAAYLDHLSWVTSLHNQSARNVMHVMPPCLRRHGVGSASQVTMVAIRPQTLTE